MASKLPGLHSRPALLFLFYILVVIYLHHSPFSRLQTFTKQLFKHNTENEILHKFNKEYFDIAASIEAEVSNCNRNGTFTSNSNIVAPFRTFSIKSQFYSAKDINCSLSLDILITNYRSEKEEIFELLSRHEKDYERELAEIPIYQKWMSISSDNVSIGSHMLWCLPFATMRLLPECRLIPLANSQITTKLKVYPSSIIFSTNMNDFAASDEFHENTVVVQKNDIQENIHIGDIILSVSIELLDKKSSMFSYCCFMAAFVSSFIVVPLLLFCQDLVRNNIFVQMQELQLNTFQQQNAMLWL